MQNVYLIILLIIQLNVWSLREIALIGNNFELLNVIATIWDTVELWNIWQTRTFSIGFKYKVYCIDQQTCQTINRLLKCKKKQST